MSRKPIDLKNETPLRIVRHVLSTKQCKVIFIVSSIAFALSYMFFTGIFIMTARPIPDDFTVPMFRVSRIHTVYGDFPWLIAYLDRNTIFSMTSEAFASTVTISSLVGLNSAILVYRSKSELRSCKMQKNSVGLFGIIPAFMCIFACCGGGAMVLLFGSGILASLFPYGPLFSLLSVSILGLGAYLGIKNIRQSMQTSRLV